MQLKKGGASSPHSYDPENTDIFSIGLRVWPMRAKYIWMRDRTGESYSEHNKKSSQHSGNRGPVVDARRPLLSEPTATNVYAVDCEFDSSQSILVLADLG